MLLSAAKTAYRLLSQGYSEPEKQTALQELLSAIRTAEDDSPHNTSALILVMTHTTSETIVEIVSSIEDKSEVELRLLKAIQTGMRSTKQRVYCSLELDIPVIQKLRDILSSSYPGNTRRAFDRMIIQLDREVLSKSPLQHLAKLGF